MPKKKYLSLLLLFLFFLSSCASYSKLLPRKTTKNLHKRLTASPIFTQGFTGFQLYDPKTKAVLYEQFANKYFTPASNTKIFTFYTASKVLGDTIPALKYLITGDSLIFWGTGDPSLLHPHLPQNQSVIKFLNNREEQLFYCPDNFIDNRYGSGWMWDDYPYSFQIEKAGLPIYGNFIRVQGEENSLNFQITPSFFADKVISDSTLGGKTARLYRQEKSNTIEYNQKKVGKNAIERALPFIYTDSLAIQLLQDSVSKPIKIIREFGKTQKQHNIVYSIPRDSILKKMMVDSDNFLAEQLILLCANELSDTLNTAKGIQLAKTTFFKNSPDELLWYDGSGLTRYNQFTPRSIVAVLEKVYQEIPSKQWPTFFKDGNSFGKPNEENQVFQPFVFAKSGSMRNVRCLSGFLFTSSGKTLIFSFMNNHIPGSSRPWTEEMETVLTFLHKEL